MGSRAENLRNLETLEICPGLSVKTNPALGGASPIDKRHFGGNRHTAESRTETAIYPSTVPSCRPVRFGVLQGCPCGYSVSPKNQKGLTENVGGHGKDGVTS